MRSNNFIEIKINTKHVFLGRLPPTPMALTFLLTQTPGVHRPSPPALATTQGLSWCGTRCGWPSEEVGKTNGVR